LAVRDTELISFFVYFQDIFATNFMCLEVMGREPKTQIAGLVALVDMAGTGMQLVFVITDDVEQNRISHGGEGPTCVAQSTI
jgi:hypothetical protein